MKAPLSGWRKLLKWILIFLGIVLVLGFLGVAVRANKPKIHRNAL
jgi:hypothetical protein